MTRLTASILLALGLASSAGCTSAPRYRASPTEPEPRSTVSIGDETVSVTGSDVVHRAQAYIGTPYRNGGTTSRGMDCSGLVYTVYRAFGIALPRTSSSQASFGRPVERSQLQPGDLVFFATSGGRRVTHVGIYSGHGEFIHASTRSRRVRFDRLDERYFRKRFVTARRVL